MWKKVKNALAGFLFLAGLTLATWASLPLRDKVDEQVLEPSAMQASSQGEKTALLDNRRVKLEWPSNMRSGDMSKISLSFIKLEGNSSQAELAGFSDAYQQYNLMAEARIEVAGTHVQPPLVIRESLPPGQPFKVTWDITGGKPGRYTGKVWLSLRFLPLDGSQPIQVPVYIHEVGGDTMGIFGWSAAVTRLIGGVGMIIGFGLVINDMIRSVRKKLIKREKTP